MENKSDKSDLFVFIPPNKIQCNGIVNDILSSELLYVGLFM